jgi:hypothetical protein
MAAAPLSLTYLGRAKRWSASMRTPNERATTHSFLSRFIRRPSRTATKKCVVVSE